MPSEKFEFAKIALYNVATRVICNKSDLSPNNYKNLYGINLENFE